MGTTVFPDWLFYTAAAALGLLGAVLLLAGLFRDWARGRRRCPKCWYDMAAQFERGSLVCPECGHDARKPRRLRRTRRRWRIAVVALLLLAVALAAGYTPRVRRDGWTKHTPTTVLIWMIPSVDRRGHPVIPELIDRFELNEGRYFYEPPREDYGLWRWQRRLLVTRCTDVLDDPAVMPWTRHFALLALSRLGSDSEPAVAALERVLATSRAQPERTMAVQALWGVGAAAEPAKNTLIKVLEENDARPVALQVMATRTLGNIGPAAVEAVPMLRRYVEPVQHPLVFSAVQSVAAIETLGRIGPGAAETSPLLITIAGDPEAAAARLAAVRAIAGIDPGAPTVRNALVDAVVDPDVRVRDTAAEGVRTDDGLLRYVIEVLGETLGAPDAEARTGAARALMALGADTPGVRPLLERAAHDDDPLVGMFALRGLSPPQRPGRPETATSRSGFGRGKLDGEPFDVQHAPDGRARLEIRHRGYMQRSPQATASWLIDVETGRRIWTVDRWLVSKYRVAFVSDDLWVVTWIDGEVLHVREPVTGRTSTIVSIRRELDRRSIVRLSRGGYQDLLLRARCAFMTHDGRPHFVLRSWRGDRLFIDVEHGLIVRNPSGTLVAACAAADRAAALARLRSDVERLRDGEAPVRWRDIGKTYDALHIVAQDGIDDAVPLLHDLDALTAPASESTSVGPFDYRSAALRPSVLFVLARLESDGSGDDDPDRALFDQWPDVD